MVVPEFGGGPGPAGADREAQTHDQEAAARAVWTVLRARSIIGLVRAAARRSRGERRVSRDHGANGRRRQDDGALIRTSGRTSAAAGAFAAEAHCLSDCYDLPMLPLRKIGEDVTETLVPHSKPVDPLSRNSSVGLRGTPAAGPPSRVGEQGRNCSPLSCRQVRPAPAAQSSERRLSMRRHRPRCIDARRLGGRRGGDPDAAGRCDRSHFFAAERRRTTPRCRQGQDADRQAYGRDDHPFAGPNPPAAVFSYSPNRYWEPFQRTLTQPVLRAYWVAKLCGSELVIECENRRGSFLT